jgi:hypothetical protein
MAEPEQAREVAEKVKPAVKPVGKRVTPEDRRLHTWPYLVRGEFICAIIVMIILTVWSIGIDAPLEEPSNPAQTPNPSKAPWYFLGLQEMLVYFDPWIAGVVLPTLIIIGLMLIPYLDINPKGNGYYTFRERSFSILTFLFGFIVLWVSMIIIGVFFRGPGWNLFWPWEKWDPHKVLALTNVDLPYWDIGGTGLPFKWMGNPKLKDIPLLGEFPARLGFTKVGETELLGGALITLYYLLGVFFYLWRREKSPTIRELGPVRYGIVAFLFLTMMGLPIKMFLRLFFNIKYVWVTPWFNI